MVELVRISTALHGREALPLRGYVDQIDSERGIDGWALDLDAPDRILTVELCVGEYVLESCRTGLRRDDISAALGRETAPGFRFSDEALNRALLRTGISADATVLIRVAGTSAVLPTARGDLSWHDFSSAKEDSESDDRDIDLSIHLSGLRSDAVPISRLPLRFDPDRQIGFIESYAIDDGGFVWITGWMHRKAFVDCPAVVVDRQKFPAGLAFSYYSRSDLPADSSGIVGVLLGDWRPSSTSRAMVFLGDGGKVHLRFIDTVRAVPIEEFSTFLSETLIRCHSGHHRALRLLAARTDGWTPLAEGLVLPDRVFVESLLVLPGFGIFASGWILCPLKAVRTLALRIGSVVLAAEPGTLTTRRRDDLAAIYPGNELLLDSAGFVCVFRGQFEIEDLVDGVLKVIYDNGSTSNHRVDPKVIRKIGHGTSLESVRALYPSLTVERYFTEFARAVLAEAKRSIRPLVALKVCSNSFAMICVLSNLRSEMFLLLAEIEMHLPEIPPELGIVLACPNGALRNELLQLIMAMPPVLQDRISVFLVHEPRLAIYQVADMTTAVNARYLVFIPSGLFLSEHGWEMVRHVPSDAAPMLRLLGVLCGQGDKSPGVATMEAFSWSVRSFLHWIAETPFRLDGMRGVKPDARQVDAADIIPRAAFRSSVHTRTHLEESIDAIDESYF